MSTGQLLPQPDPESSILFNSQDKDSIGYSPLKARSDKLGAHFPVHFHQLSLAWGLQIILTNIYLIIDITRQKEGNSLGPGRRFSG